MRKKALIGFVSLIVLMVLCYFFSGTIKTVTTPKVMITRSTLGRLTEEISTIGYLTFSDTTEITLPDVPEGTMLKITKINVSPGVYVHEGDVLLELQLSNVEDLITTQEKIYADAQHQLFELERENKTLKFHRNDENWFTAYDALIHAYDTRHAAQVMLKVEASLCGVELIDGHLPEDVRNKMLLQLQADMDSAEQEVQTALAMMDKIDRLGISEEVYQYEMKRRDLEDLMFQSTQHIVALRTLEKNSNKIVATQNGYIINVHTIDGQYSNDSSVVLTMSTTDAEITLRANTTNVTRTFEVGDVVNIRGRFGSTIKTTIGSTGYDIYGNPYIDVMLQQCDIASLDTIDNLLRNGIGMELIYTADELAYLLPASAVRCSGDQDYIYVLKEVEDAFGQLTLITEKQQVDVIDESGDKVAIAGILNEEKVVYMEDRAIGPGSEVMPYD